MCLPDHISARAQVLGTEWRLFMDGTAVPSDMCGQLHSEREHFVDRNGQVFPRRWGCSHPRLLSLRTCSV